MGHSSKDIRERFQWTFPIVFSPTEPGVLYVGIAAPVADDHRGPELGADQPGPHAGRPVDDGAVWRTRSRWTRPASRRTRRSSPWRRRRREAGTIWTGSDDGVVSVTRDGGETGHERDAAGPAGVCPHQPDRRVAARMRAPPTSPPTATSADDRAPYFYRTEDYGQTWKKIVSGIAGRGFRAGDPGGSASARDCSMRAPSTGVYVSFDGGEHWQSLRLNLPVTPVHDIAVTPNDVVIATHGRSFYVLENVGVLRQLYAGDCRRARPPVRAAGRRSGRSAGAWRSTTTCATAADKVTLEILDVGGRRWCGPSPGSTAGQARRRSREAAPAEDEPAARRSRSWASRRG